MKEDKFYLFYSNDPGKSSVGFIRGTNFYLILV